MKERTQLTLDSNRSRLLWLRKYLTGSVFHKARVLGNKRFIWNLLFTKGTWRGWGWFTFVIRDKAGPTSEDQCWWGYGMLLGGVHTKDTAIKQRMGNCIKNPTTSWHLWLKFGTWLMRYNLCQRRVKSHRDRAYWSCSIFWSVQMESMGVEQAKCGWGSICSRYWLATLADLFLQKWVADHY